MKAISVFHEYSSFKRKGNEAPIFCWAEGKTAWEKSADNSKTINVTADGSGILMFPFHGWGAFSLEQYWENGAVEFDVCGETGDEDFSIGLRSDTRGVVVTHSVLLSELNIKVVNSKQRVRIPLKKIAEDCKNGFSSKSVTMLVLTVSKPQKFSVAEMQITSPDHEKQFPVIKVNQTGYRLSGEKLAFISFFDNTMEISENTVFELINNSGTNSEAVYSGKLKAVSDTIDEISGEIVFIADFTKLNIPGEYIVRVPGVSDSFSFKIGDDVYDELFIDSLRYFYFQRQGIDLEAKYAGAFARKNLHPGDSAVIKLSERGKAGVETFDLSQGWYDAGDYGKYFPPAAGTVSDLLFAYEMFPDLFAETQLNIPESGSGMPDLLEEIKWELDMMLKMEDGTTGGFWEVANYDYDINTIFIIDTNGDKNFKGEKANTVSTAATACAASIFAHAYIVYSKFAHYAADDAKRYSTFAERCLEAAKRAWEYLKTHPGNFWVHGIKRSYRHSDVETDMFKFRAACTLFRADGSPEYDQYVLQNYQIFNYKREFNPAEVCTIGPLGIGFIHYAMSRSPNSLVVKFFDEKFTGFMAGYENYYSKNVWRTVIHDWAYFWGSSGVIARIPAELYMGCRVLGKDVKNSVQFVRNALHYLLGINPLSFSFVSGYGANCVKDIYSLIYTNDEIDEIPKGYMAGGANIYESGFMSEWPAKCYVDSDREWMTNEHAIYWNAIFALCLTIESGLSR